MPRGLRAARPGAGQGRAVALIPGPKRHHVVLFVLLHLLIIAVCGTAIWHVAAPLVGSWAEWVGRTMWPQAHNAGGLLVVLGILAMHKHDG